ncbi:Uridine 5'-monophosphate synthase [Pseudolycoriella hygida]|uniref:Uridine 5'-monophosphate synthase n=1 Tax=Pseudolycoriella hygida TaxID=35572 RepID=A0A9Q0MPV6_9DIPT|nr:Uridine 5'-monophosphate synthase [Pseudolycoriella hygida]
MVANASEKFTNLALKLFDINAFKFGDFKMKVGINSPVYFDLRVIISHPDVMNTVSELLLQFLNDKKTSCDHICGVPYTALPIATLVSVRDSKPMLIRRKEAKDYGTKKLIEGKYQSGDTCLIIEDVVTSGSSILETVNDLRREGIVVTDAIVLVDREQGGAKNIEQNGIRMHSLFTLSQLLDILQEAGKIEESTVKAVAKYISTCQIKADGSMVQPSSKAVNELNRLKMSFEARSNHARCPVAKRLFQLMAVKKSNLCIAVDLPKVGAILDLVMKIGPHICVLKTHIDVVEDFNENFVHSLVALAEKYNFLIMEDRKFADIGNTVSMQYGHGLYKISQWADLVTCHSLPGKGVLDGLKNGAVDYSNKGVFLLAEMSCRGNLINEKYTKDTMELAMDGSNNDFIAGIVCQNPHVVTNPGLIQLTPGVQISNTSDELSQQYSSPQSAIKEKGADIAVVGRGVTNSPNVAAAAEEYRDQLWSAYCSRIESEDE